MDSRSYKSNHRDFIDFLLLLYSHSKIFYVIISLFLATAFLFNLNQSTVHRFDIQIKVPASSDVFMPVIMYRDSLRQASAEKTLGQGKEFSSLGVSKLIDDFLLGGRIFFILDEKLNADLDNTVNVRDYIETERIGDYFNITVESDDPFITSFIHKNLMNNVQSEMKSVFTGIINTHKKNSVIKINSLIKQDIVNKEREFSQDIIKSDAEISEKLTQSLKKNAIYSPFSENLEYIKGLEIPNLDLPYIYFIQSQILTKNKIPQIFIYLFSIFLAIFLFIFIVISLDLKNQVFIRKEVLLKK